MVTVTMGRFNVTVALTQAADTPHASENESEVEQAYRIERSLRFASDDRRRWERQIYMSGHHFA